MYIFLTLKLFFLEQMYIGIILYVLISAVVASEQNFRLELKIIPSYIVHLL